jgi:hypothetical protein
VKECKKTKKKYSEVGKLMIVLAVLCVLLLAGLVVILISAYHKQYNNNAVSNYLCISIKEDEGVDFVGEYDDYNVYTYKLSDAYFVDFFANRIEIKDAFEKGKISLKDMTEHLDLAKEESNTKIYEFENYKIIFSQDICVIAPLSIEGEDVIQTVEYYISE